MKKVALVVDDERLQRELVARFLQAEGLEVLLAEGGQEALAVFRARRVDLVVSDVYMGDGDGLDLLRAVRAESGDLPFILISGAPDLAAAAREAGRGQEVEVSGEGLLLAAPWEALVAALRLALHRAAERAGGPPQVRVDAAARQMEVVPFPGLAAASETDGPLQVLRYVFEALGARVVLQDDRLRVELP